MTHGNFYSAFKKRCKCETCREFRNAYMRDYRRRIKENAEINLARAACNRGAVPSDGTSHHGG